MSTSQDHDRDSLEREQLNRAAGGDATAWAALFEHYRPRLERMAALRLDGRLKRRIDAADVVQEVAIQAARGLSSYLDHPDRPFFLWLRWLTGMTLQAIHRKHLGVQARDADREVRITGSPSPAASSIALAAQLLGHDTRPYEAAVRAERQRRVQEALDQLDPVDREVLALRHFEDLSNAEVARELGISEAAASKRYIRALRRMKSTLVKLGDSSEAFLA